MCKISWQKSPQYQPIFSCFIFLNDLILKTHNSKNHCFIPVESTNTCSSTMSYLYMLIKVSCHNPAAAATHEGLQMLMAQQKRGSMHVDPQDLIEGCIYFSPSLREITCDHWSRRVQNPLLSMYIFAWNQSQLWGFWWFVSSCLSGPKTNLSWANETSNFFALVKPV